MTTSKGAARWTVRLSVRDWLGIFSLALAMLGGAWRFCESVETRLAVLEIKVDLALSQGRKEVSVPGVHDSPVIHTEERISGGKGVAR